MSDRMEKLAEGLLPQQSRAWQALRCLSRTYKTTEGQYETTSAPIWATIKESCRSQHPGIDDRTTKDLKKESFQARWELIKVKLLEGTYQPSPVRRVEIPKPQGGTRPLGIPTVMDRLIQQTLCYVLNPIFEREFSEHSYGFRPGRCAAQAVIAAREFQCQGRKIVVDMDLKSFFDEVNPYLRGWFNYYKTADSMKNFAVETDQWIRRRLRLILWRQ